MGVDLTIVIDKYGLDEPILAHDRLSFRGRHYDFWDRLNAAATPLAEGLDWYGDEGIERVTTNPYGDPIKSLTAYQFMKAWDEFDNEDSHWGDWDRAIAAFIKALPPTMQIVLWFH